MTEAFDTPWELFVCTVGVYLVLSMFVLGGWAAFFEPYKAPKDAD